MNLDFSKIKKVHFIGIGGIGISALARLMVAQGKEISGTNDSLSPETLDELRAQNVIISLDQTPASLPLAHAYVYSDAWLTNNPAIIEAAKKKGAPVLSYFEMLGLISKEYTVIAIAGAHGKTTTTAMVADLLEDAGFDPTVVVGSLRAKTKSNFRKGKSKYLVVEADEYRRHFLNFNPHILIILNIDDDHLDYYKDMRDIKDAFTELVEKVDRDGYVICDKELPHIEDVVKNAKCTVVDYELFGDYNLELKVPGQHNLSNAAAVLAVADVLKIPRTEAKKSLEAFSGTWRRFEHKGKTKAGAEVYDDYGHHPAEVKATLQGAKELFSDKKIVVVFQPHLYSRTKQHLTAFGSAFDYADDVVIAPIFAARESKDESISSELVAVEIFKHKAKTSLLGGQAQSLPTFDAIENYLKQFGNDTIIITMGAGDIYKVANNLVQ
jgi:UDP-N-acetylmuramate--alanine ligase